MYQDFVRVGKKLRLEDLYDQFFLFFVEIFLGLSWTEDVTVDFRFLRLT